MASSAATALETKQSTYDTAELKKRQAKLAELSAEVETLEAEWVELSEATGAW